MFALVLAHLAAAAVLPALAARSRRAALALGALVPATALAWALAHTTAALDGGVSEVVGWAPELGLTPSFRLDALALAMVVLVSGLGAVTLAYCGGYFARAYAADPGPGNRTAAMLVAFAGLMLGLVLADDLLTLYVFWELTSVVSFLLVGQGGEDRSARRAAVQALLVTVAGGLAMLLGFVLLGQAAGTYRISEIVAAGEAGTLDVGALALGLILAGAFTKSALLPFHPWLPAAMAAPTPVSAYLHAAAMVKAGVYLVARFTPAFADRLAWTVPVVVIGLATMLLGGWRALGETDLKRLLAFGTVSQLGFLTVLFGAGEATAAIAGEAVLLAHGLFKASLFWTAGAVDRLAGTRDIRELAGLGRVLPGLAVAAALAIASMIGLPPLLGFIGKEAAFAGFDEHPWVLGGLVVGSTLTVAYGVRFWWGTFGPLDATGPALTGGPRAALIAPVWIGAVAGLVLGLAPGVVDALAQAYIPSSYQLELWHGWTWELALSALALGAGLGLHLLHRPRIRLPAAMDAQHGYEVLLDGIGRLAVRVTGTAQAGSLPGYLAVILLVVVVLPGGALVAAGVGPSDPPWAHSWLQVPLAVLVLTAALAVTRARRRFTAVLLVGAIGYGVGGLFVVDGAPDLALAQFLVETLSVVMVVLVLRRLPAHFGQSQGRTSRRVQLPKALVAVLGGGVVAALALVLSGARTEPPAAAGQMLARAPEAGASNVVAAILVDFRALDTIGETTVLFAAAAGAASLVLATRHDRRARRPPPDREREEVQR
ncbi:MAG: hydrogen gas-evolving membrane-bound hydrogenase subunit E [Pseudonocardia sp.]